MAVRYDYNLISRIQQANDIVEVISEHLRLEKKGREMVGLCPFHTDHRPSMYVNPVKQIFKCFACGAGGDVLKFVQMRENLTFPQSIERLAKRAGIDLPEQWSRQAPKPKTGELDASKLAKINAWVLDYWSKNYWNSEIGQQVREYVDQRGITEESAKEWKLGLALDQWDALTGFAVQNRVRPEILVSAGLAISRETGGFYDKFRNRLIFPIVDVGGRVIGFGGRTLADDPAKYMNSPATILFDKSHCLYGLDKARHAIVETGTAVVVEGYTDVIMTHQFGIRNVVAALGTSFTSGHAHVLRRFARRIILLFDNDTAGRTAAGRAMEVALAEKMDIRMAFVPEGKDPCDFLLQSGADAFRQILENAQEVMEYTWDRLQDELAGTETLSGQSDAVSRFLQNVAAGLASGNLDGLSRGLLITRLSELIGLSAGRIEAELKRYTGRKPNESEDAVNPAVEAGHYSVKALREILEVLLNEPDLMREQKDNVRVEWFTDPDLRSIMELLRDFCDRGIEPSAALLCGQIESPQTVQILMDLQQTGSEKGKPKERLAEALEVVRQEHHRQQAEQVKKALNQDETESLRAIHDILKKKKSNQRCAGLRNP